MTDPADRLATALADRYTIVRQIGAGGMATVYEAEDLKHQRTVALKVLKPELAAVLGTDRFLREIGVAARLNHPHILPLLDSGEADGLLYFTMPLVTGPSLAHRIRDTGPLGIDEIRTLVADVASALDYAHAQGIVHRDLKPDNVLLHHGKPMIADFGIALAVSQVGGERLTETGLSIGTPQYMSPEQVSGERMLDARSDVYALGCLVYEMVVGDPPFTGRTAQAVMARQVTDPAPPIRTVRRDVPAAVDAAVTKALAKVPGDRFDSAGQLAIALATPEPVSVQEISVSIERQEAAPRRTIAVLPFANLSTDPENEYFSDGITDDVMSQLSKVGELKVISRTSTTRFRDTELSLREIGEQLNADVILEGTVRKAGSRVRIVAQLIDARNDTHVWNDTYDRMLTDVFEIQSEVAISIAEALEAKLSPKERREIFKKPTDDLEAYDLYLLGRHHCNKRAADDLRRAITCFEQAIERDAGYAEAYAGLAEVYVFAGIGYLPMNSAEAYALAKQMALRAIELNPDRPTAHSMLGFVTLTCDWDPGKAERSLARALEIDGNHVQAYQWLGWSRTIMGDYLGGSEAWERALELDPLSAVITVESGWPFAYAGLHEHALERFQRALDLEPDLALAHFCIGWAQGNLGRYQEAVQALEKSVELYGGAAFWRAFLASAAYRSGHRERAELLLQDLIRQAEQQGGMGVSVAIAAEALGHKDLALDWLERAYASRDEFLYALQILDFLPFSSLRGHLRFEAVLDGVGIPPHDVESERVKLLERERARTAAQAQKATENGEPTARTQGTSAAEGSGATGVGLRAEPRFRELAREMGLAEETQKPPAPPRQARASSDKPMIVVLPLTNMSPSVEDEYFSDGMTEDIIAQLSQIGSLQVISRTSAMRYKNSTQSVKEIAGALGATHVVEGSVRRAGDKLRIVAQLIDASSDAHLWAQTFDREMTDVFAIQSEVAEHIAGALQRRLTPDERRRFARRPTADMEAYREYLLGRHHWARWTEDDFKESIRHFQAAIERDPKFAEAHVALSEAWSHLGTGYWTVRPLDAYPKARDAAMRAMELDPDSAEAHARLAMVEWWFEFAFDRALERTQRAASLNPNSASAFDYHANILTMLGRHDEALAFGQRACELDPASIFINANYGLYLYRARRWSEAIEQFKRVIDLDPNLPMGHALQALAYVESGDDQRALQGFRRADELSAGHHAYRVMLGYGHAAVGDEERARQIFREIEAVRAEQNIWLVMLAMGNAKLGETECAVDLLEDAYRERGGWIVWAGVEPGLDSLRDHARFQTLTARLGLPQATHRNTNSTDGGSG